MLQAPADLKTMLDGTFVVGTIARLAGVKRIDRLLKSYALFSEGKNLLKLESLSDSIRSRRQRRELDRVVSSLYWHRHRYSVRNNIGVS